MHAYVNVSRPFLDRYHERCHRTRVLRIAGAILCLTVAGAADAGSLPPPAIVAYRIVPLAPQTYPAADINAKGQVAFTEIVSPGITRARMYDGAKVRDLGSLGGNSTAVALNDLGQVTGLSYLAGNGTVYQAYRWSPWSGMLDLSRPGVLGSTGLAINNLGMVAGDAVFADAPQARAFRWVPGIGMRNLGSLNGYSSAGAINDLGVTAGYSEAAPPRGGIESIPTRWTLAPVPQPLLASPFPFSRGYDINAVGHIAGVGLLAPNPSNSSSAFLWTTHDGATDLRVPGEAYAEHVNDKDMVGGLSLFGPVNGIGFVWTRNDGPVLLGTPGVDESNVRDVNNHGQVVGRSNGRAYVWTRAAGIVDLNARLKDAPHGLELDEAYAISDNGSIVASGNTGLVLLVPDHGGKGPAVIGVIMTQGTARPGALLSFAAGFTDSNRRDTHTARWSWGDGKSDEGNVAAAQGRGSVSGQHAYRAPGVYPVQLTVIDSDGNRSVAQTTVVVSASGAVLAGDGSFVSARGASRLAPHHAGIARFSFRSADTPDLAAGGGGQAAIRISAPGVEFDSGGFDDLSSDLTHVRYTGQGSLNGRAGYRFTLGLVRGTDAGDPDRVHARITHRDPATHAEVVDYDNAGAEEGTAQGQDGAPLLAGSRVRLRADRL